MSRFHYGVMARASAVTRVITRGITCAAMLAVAIAGCDKAPAAGNAAAHDAVLTISTPADADALLPVLVQSTQGKQAADLLFDYLAAPADSVQTVGDGAFRPQLATRWTWANDSLSIAFAIDPAARWHDGAPVRASDVRFSFALYTDPRVASPQASAFDGIDSVTVRDSLTAVAWWSRRHPEQFFQLAYNLAVMPEHAMRSIARDSLASSAFATKPVGSGRYRFETWRRGADIVLAADTTNYRGRPGFGRVIWVVAADPNTAGMRVLAGQADVLEQLRGDAFTQARTSTRVATVEYGSFDYAYLLFNHARTVAGTPRLFADHAVRVAMTTAIDRASVVANALDSLGQVALGPFTRAESSVDREMRQLRFDAAAASRVLDSLGWRRGADGVRSKGGRLLHLELLVPSSSSTRMRIAVLLQEQLRTAGVTVDVAPVEPGVFFARLEKGDFDAALNMWRAVPSPTSVQDVWGAPRGVRGSANFGSYRNVAFDALLDSASQSFVPSARTALLRRAYQLVVDDAAAIWLYEPRNFAAVSRRVQPTGMRPDAWWAAIPDWTLAAPAVASAKP